jgi:hypothetical protein
MIRCLEDKTLFLLSEGEASEEQRSHLQSCQACTERYREIERDLRLITHTLQQEPAPLRFAAPGASIFRRALPLAAGVLLAIALVWGESRLWRPDSSSEQTLSGDLSQFLEQVSEALFDGGNIRDVETSSSDSDLASLQVALGENCSDDCRGLFNNSLSISSMKSKTKTVDRPVVTVKRRPIDPTMQRMVSDRAE